MNARTFLLLIFSGSGVLLGTVGGRRVSLQAAEEKAVRGVSVSRPVAREVTDFADFTGVTEAANSVNVVARASGYLVKTCFQEGSDIKSGDLLFELDPRPYQAPCDLARSQLNLHEAEFKLAQATLARDQQLVRATPGVVSPQQLEQDRAAVAQAEAKIKTAQASLEISQLNLSLCKVVSPINGRAGRYYLTPGNLVTQDQTVLTTIVSLDPIYAYFDADATTVLRIRREFSATRTKSSSAGQVSILMGLAWDEGFPHKGVVNFVDNQGNPKTGSVRVRGVFSNPVTTGGERSLMPGMFTRVRLPIGQPHKSLLVIDRAIHSDNGRKYVYIVNVEGEPEQRRVETGSLENDGLRIITQGLTGNDQVVVGELYQIQPGMKVQVEIIPMPPGGAGRRDQDSPKK
jgi:membrane fusion protein, multidrug efflux system